MLTKETGGFRFRFGGGEQIGIVVTHVADAVADGPGMHLFSRVGAEQVGRGMGGIARLEPAVVVARFEDDGHAVVESFGDLVGIGGDDSKGFEGLAVFRFPGFPKAGEGAGLSGAEGDGEGAFGFGVQLLPFIEGVGGHEAAAFLEGFTIGGLGDDLFGARVDSGEAELGVLSPEGYEAPAGNGEFARARVAIEAHDELGTLGRRVEGGREPGHVFQFDAEPVGEDFLGRASGESTAHRERIMRRSWRTISECFHFTLFWNTDVRLSDVDVLHDQGRRSGDVD
jgi:hypothetical protein